MSQSSNHNDIAHYHDRPVSFDDARTQAERPTLFLTATSKRADALCEDLRTLLGEREGAGRTGIFPRHDTLPYDHFSPQPYLLAERMAVLYQWLASGSAASPAAGRAAAPIVMAPSTTPRTSHSRG